MQKCVAYFWPTHRHNFKTYVQSKIKALHFAVTKKSFAIVKKYKNLIFALKIVALEA